MAAWAPPCVDRLHGVLALLPQAQITPVAHVRLVQSFPGAVNREKVWLPGFVPGFLSPFRGMPVPDLPNHSVSETRPRPRFNVERVRFPAMPRSFDSRIGRVANPILAFYSAARSNSF